MGQRVSVRSVMSTDFVGVSEADIATDVAVVLIDHREDLAVVLRGSEPVGVVHARGLLDACVGGDDETTVGEVMDGNPPTIPASATIEQAADKLLGVEFDRLIVVDDEQTAVGVLSAVELLAVTDRLVTEPAEATLEAGGPRSSPPSLSEQGICESCGRLADELSELDGTLICEACRNQ